MSLPFRLARYADDLREFAFSDTSGNELRPTTDFSLIRVGDTQSPGAAIIFYNVK